VIVVDSNVWIDFLNGRNAPHVRRLRAVLGTDEIIVGELMLCEILQGLENERVAREVEALLRRFEIAPMAGDAIAVRAARNFRSLRQARHHRPQDHRLVDRHLVRREPQAAPPQRRRFSSDGAASGADRGTGDRVKAGALQESAGAPGGRIEFERRRGTGLRGRL